MIGINANSGKSLGEIDHLRQSIRDILTTPIGTRVMRRDYGSRLFQLTDAPLNRTTILELYAATAQAIARWEPRFSVQQVKIAEASAGYVVLDLIGIYKPDGKKITLDGILVT